MQDAHRPQTKIILRFSIFLQAWTGEERLRLLISCRELVQKNLKTPR